jgi:hypothetical protein
VVSDEKVNERVIENLGEYITRFQIEFEPPTTLWQQRDLYDDFSIKLSGHGYLDNRTVIGNVLHQFRPRAGGFDANLCIYYPASVPEELLEQHRQHLVVEFTNWTRRCYEETKAKKAQN